MGGFWLFWLLIIIGVALIVVLLVRLLASRYGGGPRPAGTGRSAARRLLDGRYARGELSTEEYQERLQALGEGDR